MTKQHLSAFAIFLALFQILSAGKVNAQNTNSRIFSERFVVQAARAIHSAEATYQATVGAGTYGTFLQLSAANLIDEALASGEKYGYHFALSVTHRTATMPEKFTLNVTPQVYPKSGRRSFYIDQEGDIYGADKRGAAATSNDPLLDDCSLYGDAAGNERCTILALRALYSAELTFSTSGNGAFGILTELYLSGLIGRAIASGQPHGYNFTVTTYAPPNPSFKVEAVPQSYGVTGRRSFYLGTDGVIRGADHQGGAADENDPPVTEN